VTRCCKREDAKSEKEQSSSEMLFCSEKPPFLSTCNRLKKKRKIGIRATLLTFARSELLTPVIQD